MTKLQSMASVHEHTVIHCEEHLAKPRRRPRKPANRVQVNQLKVDPRIWKKALELSKGNPRRIEVLASDSVVVHNSPDWKTWKTK